MWTLRVSVTGLVLALLAPAWAGPPSKSAAKPAAAATGGKTGSASSLHFIADDPAAALAEAKRRGVPVFVEAWAPW